MASKVDIAELRRLKAISESKDAFCEDLYAYMSALRYTAPALLDELERLRKIASRLPEKCCLTCGALCVFGMPPYNPLGLPEKQNCWLPLDGEKEE